MFDELINEMSKCDKCLHRKNKFNRDCSLINIYEDTSFAKNIPSIWTDWYNRLDSKIMIIGQDWGPFEDMKSLYERFKSGEDWVYLINQEKSLTKKNLEKFLGSVNIFLDDVFITNAIMCARKGSNYRGNNIDLKYSTSCCSNFLKRQIEIVKPKVIITLGYYPLYSLSNIFGFNIESNLKDTIDKYNIFKVDDYVVIPMFHPVAQVSHDIQIKRYKDILKYL